MLSIYQFQSKRPLIYDSEPRPKMDYEVYGGYTAAGEVIKALVDLEIIKIILNTVLAILHYFDIFIALDWTTNKQLRAVIGFKWSDLNVCDSPTDC